MVRVFKTLMHLRWAVSYHCENMTQVNGKGLDVWVRKAVRVLLLKVFNVVVNMNYAILHLQLVVQVLGDTLH